MKCKLISENDQKLLGAANIKIYGKPEIVIIKRSFLIIKEKQKILWYFMEKNFMAQCLLKLHEHEKPLRIRTSEKYYMVTEQFNF